MTTVVTGHCQDDRVHLGQEPSAPAFLILHNSIVLCDNTRLGKQSVSQHRRMSARHTQWWSCPSIYVYTWPRRFAIKSCKQVRSTRPSNCFNRKPAVCKSHKGNQRLLQKSRRAWYCCFFVRSPAQPAFFFFTADQHLFATR